MVDYDNFGDGSNDINNNDSDGDYDNVQLKITPYAAINGTIKNVFASGSQWGQSLGWIMDDVELVDGALYDRGGGTYKVFSWKDLGFTGDMEYTSEDAPRVNSESFGSNTYSYELIDARADDFEDTDLIEIGDAVIFEGANEENGPSATSKCTARTLTDKGRDSILDENSYDSWLDTDVDLRDDLEDVRILYYKVKEQGDDGPYHLPIFRHKRLDSRIKIDNLVEDTQEGEEQEAEEEPEPDADSDDGPFPNPVQEFIEFCQGDDSVDDESSVEMMLSGMVSKEDSELTESMVEQARDDIVVAALE